MITLWFLLVLGIAAGAILALAVVLLAAIADGKASDAELHELHRRRT